MQMACAVRHARRLLQELEFCTQSQRMRTRILRRMVALPCSLVRYLAHDPRLQANSISRSQRTSSTHSFPSSDSFTSAVWNKRSTHIPPNPADNSRASRILGWRLSQAIGISRSFHYGCLAGTLRTNAIFLYWRTITWASSSTTQVLHTKFHRQRHFSGRYRPSFASSPSSCCLQTSSCLSSAW